MTASLPGALPSRLELRAALAPFVRPSTALAIVWVVADLLVFVAASAVTVQPIWIGWKALASVVIGVQIARLFILGHDACHQSLTRHRRLNRIVGRLVFLPSLTPYSLWDLGHNQAHHGFTNLRGRDGVWVPYRADEFSALPKYRQWLERAYRSGWCPGLYYVVELWWRKLFFPAPQEVGGTRPVHRKDSAVVAIFALTWAALLCTCAHIFGTSKVQALLFGEVLPLAIWTSLMGFVIYVHHTEPEVAWFDQSEAWAASRPYLSATVLVEAPWLDRLLHHIFQHPAHHLDMTIPFYRLKEAQRRLQVLVPDQIEVRRLTWSYYWQVVATCKVYDYTAAKWAPFPTLARTAQFTAP